MSQQLGRIAMVLFLLAGGLLGQVTLKQGAVVYFGTATKTTAPASIDEDKVREATPEWKTIQAEGVKKGSARYKLLIAEMEKRIREAVRAAAEHSSNDLVVRSGDVEDAKGKEVADLTSEVISQIDSLPEAAGIS